jgi:DNA-binding CsgD family transcriptional regulator
VVYDRETAFLPVSDGSWGAVVVREPHTVACLCELFEQTREQAPVFADAAGQGLEQVAREIDQTVLRLLGEGLKDEAIARRLGMSLRKARRHIADIMDRLGADSRFQAGAAAAQAGLLVGDGGQQRDAAARPVRRESGTGGTGPGIWDMGPVSQGIPPRLRTAQDSVRNPDDQTGP